MVKNEIDDVLANIVAKFPQLRKTHCGELLNLIRLNCEPNIRFVTSNYTAQGVEAVIKDSYDSQLYTLTLVRGPEEAYDEFERHSY